VIRPQSAASSSAIFSKVLGGSPYPRELPDCQLQVHL
jgi:hypothetical protein